MYPTSTEMKQSEFRHNANEPLLDSNVSNYSDDFNSKSNSNRVIAEDQQKAMNQRQIMLKQDNQEHLQANKNMAGKRYMNAIKTSKYTPLNFIPLNLMNQFKKAPNIYFLCITFMQCIKSISISDGQPVMAMPLALVVMASMIKDAYEDYKRHQSDRSENEKQCYAYNPQSKEFELTLWKNISVGMIVKIQSEEFIPADILLLNSSDPKHIGYVETKGLDGETNLKIKSVQKQMSIQFTTEERVTQIQGHILCERPNSAIYKFEGYAQLNSGQEKISLNADYLLLRGMSLRNTEHIYGIVVFTSDDTKIMQNSAKPKYKFSSLELQTNTSILIIIGLQVCLALLAATIGTIWIVNNDSVRTFENDASCFKNIDGEEVLQNYYRAECSNAIYLDYSNVQLNGSETSVFVNQLIKKIGTWILIFTNFVPISLMVTLEIVKLFQANLMSYDVTMYDEEQDMEMRAQASNLNEELGQVEYVFSDKTGTLTQNVMEFRKFTAGSKAYGLDDVPDQLPQESNVRFYDPLLNEILDDPENKHHEVLKRSLIFLACCHTIIIDEKKGTYNAASPDELALVNAAKQFGFIFQDRDKDDNIVIFDKRNNKELKYQLLNICEFTSTRKRMSCVFRTPEGKIVVMCKGADSVIAEYLTTKSLESEHMQTQPIVDQFARLGLRTLYLAERVVPESEYEAWNEKSRLAKLEVNNREEAVSKVDGEIEKELELIGSTAIEDKLQENVSDTIKFMKATGIKVWVLTGDKVETAINIGLSAGLLDNDNMDQHIIQESTISQLKGALSQVKKEILENRMNKKQAIIIAGASLLVIDSNEELREHFLGASDNSDVVLACRVSPKQKADIVNMIRKRFPKKVTLSIGDGANDVNMILQAHVGVGILGKEGQQAARSADYAIGQFQHLKPLMFIHGREAYRRNSMLIKYNFYKNVLYVMTQYYFGFWSAFSGQTLYDSVIYQLYNITMTSLPIMYFALYDFEFSKETFMKYPTKYLIGMNSECYGRRVFVQWLLLAMWHAIIIYLVCLWAIDGVDTSMENGMGIGFWFAGHVVYGSCVIVANWQILHKFNIHDGYNLIPISLMIIAFFLFFGIMSVQGSFPILTGLFSNALGQPLTWLCMFLVIAQVSIQEIFYRAWKLTFQDQNRAVSVIDTTSFPRKQEQSQSSASQNYFSREHTLQEGGENNQQSYSLNRGASESSALVTEPNGRGTFAGINESPKYQFQKRNTGYAFSQDESFQVQTSIIMNTSQHTQ